MKSSVGDDGDLSIGRQEKDDHFSTAAFIDAFEQSASALIASNFCLVMFSYILLCVFFFCLLSLGLRRLMILVKLVLICYF